MYTAKRKTKYIDGFAIFEIFKDGKSTNLSYEARNAKYAIKTHIWFITE